jgi:formate dehydrogenase major subunit
MINLVIDGKTVEVPEGTTVLGAAESAGIRIPTLCDHPHLTPFGGCRLCIVEVEGMRLPTASCTLPAGQGMVVHTDTPRLRTSRQFILNMLFSERNHFCPFCVVSGGDCELQNAAYAEDMTHWTYQPGWKKFPVDASHPDIILDHNRCILCRRCVRACGELVGNYTLSIAERGSGSILVADQDVPLGESTCISCGMCIQVCPTGALIDRNSAYLGVEARLEKTPSTCLGCSVGCSVEIFTRDNQLVRIQGDWNSPLNQGLTCNLGRFSPLNEQRTRLSQPLLRNGDHLEAVSWDEALDAAVQQLQPLLDSEDSGISALVSTRLPAETLAMFKHIFVGQFNSQMVTTVEEGRPTAMPALFADQTGSPFEGDLEMLQTADCVVAIGVNPDDRHQVVSSLLRRRLYKGLKLVLINPMESVLDSFAECILRPSPGEDAAIFHAITDAVESVQAGDTRDISAEDNAAALTGIQAVAATLAASQQVFFLFGKGLSSQASPESIQALSGLANQLRLGGEGKQAALLSVKGEANSLAASQLHLDPPFELRPHAIAYLAMGDDYASQRLMERVSRAPFKIVEASYQSELTDMADIVFPVSTWAEQSGHYINLDGRVQLAQQVLQSPDNVWTSESLETELARRLGLNTDVDWQAELHQRVPSVELRSSIR